MVTAPTISRPFVSIAIPCRNEARYIAGCLDSILVGDYPLDRLEILVADGLSDDGTREILRTFAAEHSCITVLDNHQLSTPAALNLAIRSASGTVVIRMDAHVLYPPNYVRRLVEALEETGADNVGGVLETVPADDSPTARAIAVGLSHPFGVGNSHFRTGTRQRREVDTVPFGCYRRETFDRIGLFDEALVRNQDDELNFRLIAHGGRILLLPEVTCRYFARRSFRQVARMYYQYGYFKPLVAHKLGRIMTVRQLVPSLLIATLFGSASLSLWVPGAGAAFASVAAVYAGFVLACSAAATGSDLRCGLALAGVFPTLHFSYGFGFLRGIYDHLIARSIPKARKIDFSR
ncbi:MAG: glycosyltransferase family 2 protein [Gemmatimonadales bacterium]